MNHATIEELIAFENGVKAEWERGELPYLLHLAGGNEGPLVDIFARIKKGDWIFGSHRSHYHYLLAGGDPVELGAKIRDGQSMFLYKRDLNFLASAILAGNCCIAAGVALAIQEAHGPRSSIPPHVWCFLGDGAEDEGHFYEAVRFVQGRCLPCTFIIEDNNRSVDTSVAKRHGTETRFEWGSHVIRYHYTPTYPHAGSGCKFKIEFKPKANPWTRSL